MKEFEIVRVYGVCRRGEQDFGGEKGDFYISLNRGGDPGSNLADASDLSL
jgi:hypothetical protein